MMLCFIGLRLKPQKLFNTDFLIDAHAIKLHCILFLVSTGERLEKLELVVLGTPLKTLASTEWVQENQGFGHVGFLRNLESHPSTFLLEGSKLPTNRQLKGFQLFLKKEGCETQVLPRLLNWEGE